MVGGRRGWRGRRPALAALAVTLALAVGGCADGGGGDGGGSPETETVDTTPAELAELARRFAPVVWIHSGETHGPEAAEVFLADAELRWRRRFAFDRLVAARGTIVAGRLGEDCESRSAGCYLYEGHPASAMTRPHDDRPDREEGLSVGAGFYLVPDESEPTGQLVSRPTAPIYYEVREGKRTRIAYWLFYGFSSPFKPFVGVNLAGWASHQGDWEGIEVVLTPAGRPSRVHYYSHGHPEVRAWGEVCKWSEEGEDCDGAGSGRPVVFAARESHASYASPAVKGDSGSAQCMRILWLERAICSYDVRDRGRFWDPLAPGGLLLSVRSRPWYGFGGAWGRAERFAEMTGPLGPSRYKLPAELEPGELVAVPPARVLGDDR